jgi:hypothetical protein
MTSASVIRLIDTVKTACPAALDGGIRRELFDVLREFFDRSDCWLFELVVQIEPNANDYRINTCQNVIVSKLVTLSRPRTPPPMPAAYLPMDPPQYLQLWSIDGQYGTSENINPIYNVPRDAVLLDAGIKCPIMRIRWNPRATELWIATLSLNLTDPTDSEGLPAGVPSWIIDKYFRQISSGVISRLMLQPGKPYSSQAGAAFHGRKFNDGIGLARTEARHMYTYSGQRWAFPQGWNYRRPRVN